MSSAGQVSSRGDRSESNSRALPLWWQHWGSTILGLAVIALLVYMAIVVHDVIWWVLAGMVTLWLGYHVSWLMKSLDD